MKLNKQIWILYFSLIITILISSNVFGFGISPARKIVDFQSNLTETAEFKIINSDHKSMRLLVYLNDIQDDEINLKIDNSDLIFDSDDQEKVVSYSYNLPEKFEKPGPHEFSIITREVPMNPDDGGTVIVASVAVEHILKVNVPYPGKYASVELKVSETNNDAINFIVVVNNLGSEQIISSKGIIDIYNLKNEKINSLETSVLSIDSGSSKETMVVWEDLTGPGEYKATLNLIYDNQVAMCDKYFQVGEANVNILHIYSNDFRLGEIAKFNILVENKWSEKIKEVYTDLLISDKGNEVGRFKSATEDINELSKKELTAYWDSEGVEEGEYDAKFALHYNDKIIEKDMKTKIEKNSISFSGFSGAVVSDSPFNKNNIIAFGIIIIVINAVWIIYFKFRKKK